MLPTSLNEHCNRILSFQKISLFYMYVRKYTIVSPLLYLAVTLNTKPIHKEFIEEWEHMISLLSFHCRIEKKNKSVYISVEEMYAFNSPKKILCMLNPN